MHSTSVYLKFGELQGVLEWCKKSCANSWSWLVIDSGGAGTSEYDFRFDSTRDMTLFNMKFK